MEARQRGRYALENDEHVDVLLGRSIPTVDGMQIVFDELWARRHAEDLRLIAALRRKREGA